jgi:cyanate permease
MASQRRGVVPVAVFFVGLIGLFGITREPRFATFRAVDVVQLLGSGMCFGVGLMALVTRLREPRT